MTAKDLNPSTLKALSKKLNLSPSTVSRILSGQTQKYRISKKTEQRVLEEAARLDFAPNQVARGLRLHRTNTLGLIIPDIANPFFSTLARHVERQARIDGYSIFLCDTEESTAIEMESLHLMNRRNVDGIIISPVGQAGEHLEELHKKGIPIALVDRYFPDLKIPFVTSDNYHGAFQAMEYLITHGHRNIACIQGIQNASSTRDRVKGYQDALAAHQIDADPTFLTGDRFDRHTGYMETKVLLQRTPRPTAIFSLGNLITMGVLSAIAEENLRVPQDISIVSFDEQPYSAFLSTPLTTIAQQTDIMGEIAVKILRNHIESKNPVPPEKIFLPTKLNIRNSVCKCSHRSNT